MMSASTAKAIVAAAVLFIVIAAFVGIVVITAPLTGVGITVGEPLPQVSSFSFEVDRDGLIRAERVLADYARERGLKLSRTDVPMRDRQALLLRMSLVRAETTLIADNVTVPDRLDVRLSSSAPADKWQPAARDIQLRLESALRRERNRS